MAERTPKDRNEGTVVATGDSNAVAEPMSCETCQTQLLAYHYGELDETRAAEVEQALARCEECARALAALQLTAEAYAQVPVPEPSARVRQNVLREARLRVAARHERAGGIWAPLMAWAVPVAIVAVGGWVAVNIATSGDAEPTLEVVATAAVSEFEASQEEPLGETLAQELVGNSGDDEPARATEREPAPDRVDQDSQGARRLERTENSAPAEAPVDQPAARSAEPRPLPRNGVTRGARPSAVSPSVVGTGSPGNEVAEGLEARRFDGVAENRGAALEGAGERDLLELGGGATGYGGEALGLDDADRATPYRPAPRAPARAEAEEEGADLGRDGFALAEERERSTGTEAQDYASRMGAEEAQQGAVTAGRSQRSQRRNRLNRGGEQPASTTAPMPAAAGPPAPSPEPVDAADREQQATAGLAAAAEEAADAERDALSAGRAAFDRGQWAAAIAALEPWLRAGAGTGLERQEAMYLLGAARVRIGDETGARSTLEELVRLWPRGRWSTDARSVLDSLSREEQAPGEPPEPATDGRQ